MFLSSSTILETALSIPFLRSTGLAPDVKYFKLLLKILWANTVAVVVPSPAPLVFEDTTFINWAPVFSTGSFNSISLATETPSLVIVAGPYFFF